MNGIFSFRVSAKRASVVFNDIATGSDPGLRFYVMVGASTAIASFGLIMDSTAVVIGAMLVAPLMTPILGLSLALVRGNAPLLGRAIQAVTVGTILSVALSAGFGFLMPAMEATPEMLARTRPNLLDLLVAVFAGFAGAYALVDEHLSPALPGVAIATAIVPPLANSGLCLALGSYYGAAGSFLLFFTNFLSILLVASLVFVASGMVREPESITKTTAVRRFGWAAIGFLIVAAFLTKTLYDIVVFKRTRIAISAELTEQFSQLPGAELRGVIHEKRKGKVFVLAQAYTVIDIRPSTVKMMEEALEKKLQEPVELFVRKRVVRDISSSGSDTLVFERTLDGYIVEQKPDPQGRFLKLARQIIYEYMETQPGVYLDKVKLINLSGRPQILATILAIRDISPEDMQKLEDEIRQRSQNDMISITFRQVQGTSLNRLGKMYHEWTEFQALTPEKEALFQKVQEFIKKEFAKSGYYLTNLYLSIREGINYILVELTGPQLYSQAELVELRKKLEKVTGNKVRLYVRSIPEVVVTESGYMSFKELQDKMWKQAETLYHKELEKIIKEGL